MFSSSCKSSAVKQIVEFGEVTSFTCLMLDLGFCNKKPASQSIFPEATHSKIKTYKHEIIEPSQTKTRRNDERQALSLQLCSPSLPSSWKIQIFGNEGNPQLLQSRSQLALISGPFHLVHLFVYYDSYITPRGRLR